MYSHLRANLWLLGLTLLLCSLAYPLILLGIGQTLFPHQAQGSLLTDKDGTVIGSRLIGQPFSGDEYFQPRPSAASYNASASGASNWGANNYLLRDRVARMVGPVVAYREGLAKQRALEKRKRDLQEKREQLTKLKAEGKATPEAVESAKNDLENLSKIADDPRVAPDVEFWFRFQAGPEVVTDWVKSHPKVAEAWVNADDKHKQAVEKWAESHPQVVEAWNTGHPDSDKPNPSDLASEFFESQAKTFHESWPKLIDDATWSVSGVFFDAWLQKHPEEAADLQPVPADMVLASGSGLDPHITYKNALYQLDRVTNAWAEKTKSNPKTLRVEIEILLRKNAKAQAPLGGLVGVDLINVLEVNLAMHNQFR